MAPISSGAYGTPLLAFRLKYQAEDLFFLNLESISKILGLMKGRNFSLVTMGMIIAKAVPKTVSFADLLSAQATILQYITMLEAVLL